jgi:hypothetical protein
MKFERNKLVIGAAGLAFGVGATLAAQQVEGYVAVSNNRAELSQAIGLRAIAIAGVATRKAEAYPNKVLITGSGNNVQLYVATEYDQQNSQSGTCAEVDIFLSRKNGILEPSSTTGITISPNTNQFTGYYELYRSTGIDTDWSGYGEIPLGNSNVIDVSVDGNNTANGDTLGSKAEAIALDILQAPICNANQ